MTDSGGQGFVPSSARLGHIDCLRAVAALAVVVHHVLEAAVHLTNVHDDAADIILNVIYGYLDLGRMGVLLFFIISGYCIANSILRPQAKPVAAFVVNRVARIYPAYWLSLLGVIIVFGALSPSDLLINALLLQTFLHRPDIMGIYWTLAVELTFYAVCIVLFVSGMMNSFRRLGFVWSGLIAYCVLAAVIRNLAGIPVPYATPWFLSLMFGGALLRRIDDEGLHGSLIKWGVTITLGAALIIAICIYSDASVYGKSWERDFIANALAVGLFVIGSYRIRLSSIVFSYLGRISYSIYLFHSLVFVLIERHYAGSFENAGMGGAIILLAISLSLTIALAAAVFHLVEIPGIRLGRRIVAGISGAPGGSFAASPDSKRSGG